MPKHIRTKAQAKSDKRAVRKLRELGIIKRADLRRPPTAAQKRTIRKYADVVSGRAKVVRPKNPSSYKKLFRVAGKNVIVPKRKGERVSVNRAGEIVRKRKVGGRKSRGTFKHAPRPEEFRPRKGHRVVYALPVNRGGGEIEWYRYASWDKLVADMQTGSLKGYRNFTDYVVEEELEPGERLRPDEDDEEDRNAALDDKLETKLVRKREQRAFTGRFPAASLDPFASRKK